jgi:hypothetical protein
MNSFNMGGSPFAHPDPLRQRTARQKQQQDQTLNSIWVKAPKTNIKAKSPAETGHSLKHR